MPAFEGSDGVLLTESNAIAYYLGNEELRGGADAAARAQVRLNNVFLTRYPSLLKICTVSLDR